jgi:hypothetical protein
MLWVSYFKNCISCHPAITFRLRHRLPKLLREISSGFWCKCPEVVVCGYIFLGETVAGTVHRFTMILTIKACNANATYIRVIVLSWEWLAVITILAFLRTGIIGFAYPSGVTKSTGVLESNKCYHWVARPSGTTTSKISRKLAKRSPWSLHNPHLKAEMTRKKHADEAEKEMLLVNIYISWVPTYITTVLLYTLQFRYKLQE